VNFLPTPLIISLSLSLSLSHTHTHTHTHTHWRLNLGPHTCYTSVYHSTTGLPPQSPNHILLGVFFNTSGSSVCAMQTTHCPFITCCRIEPKEFISSFSVRLTNEFLTCSIYYPQNFVLNNKYLQKVGGFKDLTYSQSFVFSSHYITFY
jgi:hypothetical protein